MDTLAKLWWRLERQLRRRSRRAFWQTRKVRRPINAYLTRRAIVRSHHRDLHEALREDPSWAPELARMNLEYRRKARG